MPDPNELFKLKLDGKSRLRILLSDKPRPVAASGPVRTARPSTTLHRRPRPDEEVIAQRKQEGLINFYDLGQILDGVDYIDIPWRVVPTPDAAGTYVPFAPADWDTFWDYIFTVPIADWEDNYRKLEYAEAERYGLDIFDNVAGLTYDIARNGPNLGNDVPNPVSDTKWTPQGLRVPASFSTNFTVECGAFGAFMMFARDPAFTKVTAVYDYSASAVPFELAKKNTTIFLVPRITSTYMHSTNIGVADDTVTYPYAVLPRSFFLARNYDVDPYPLYSVGGGLDLSSADKIALQALIQDDPDSQYWETTAGYSGDPSPFPAYSDPTIEILQTGGPIPIVNFFPGTLLMVVKQGSNTYFIWSTETGSTTGGRTVIL